MFASEDCQRVGRVAQRVRIVATEHDRLARKLAAGFLINALHPSLRHLEGMDVGGKRLSPGIIRVNRDRSVYELQCLFDIGRRLRILNGERLKIEVIGIQVGSRFFLRPIDLSLCYGRLDGGDDRL